MNNVRLPKLISETAPMIARAAPRVTLPTRLRTMLQSSKPLFLMEAHNGISAQIVKDTGFSAIWASGLTMSASTGMRDSNEISFTHALDILSTMNDATGDTIPILFDGDTGYGNYNNARRLVRKLEERNVGGVVFEDKLFPKTNSFINSEAQTLADRIEHANKITACKEYQRVEDFSVVARLESLITGAGVEDALLRAETYTQAGADAILVHSKKGDFTEIAEFCELFKKINAQCRDIPLIVVPTKYYMTPVNDMLRAGVTNFIWANHLLRGSVAGMEQTARQIFLDQGLHNIEHSVATVETLFYYQNDKGLRMDDKRYLNLDNLVTQRPHKPEVNQEPRPSGTSKMSPTLLRSEFAKNGIEYHVGVPDSVLKEYFQSSTDQVVAHEGIALSLAAGYSDRKSVV